MPPRQRKGSARRDDHRLREGVDARSSTPTSRRCSPPACSSTSRPVRSRASASRSASVCSPRWSPRCIITRVLVDIAVRRKVVKNHPQITGIANLGRVREWLTRKNLDLMRSASAGSPARSIALVIAIAGIGIRGLDFGVEFTGGRLVEYSTTPAAVGRRRARGRLRRRLPARRRAGERRREHLGARRRAHQRRRGRDPDGARRGRRAATSQGARRADRAEPRRRAADEGADRARRRAARAAGVPRVPLPVDVRRLVGARDGARRADPGRHSSRGSASRSTASSSPRC